MSHDEREFNAILTRISHRLRENVDDIKEYEITTRNTKDFQAFGPTFFGVSYDEYQAAQQLKLTLLKRFEGKALEDVLTGEELATRSGVCYHITNHDNVRFTAIRSDKAREKILANLTLIYGIGETTECALKEQGYETIKDLIGHPRFGPEAATFVQLINHRNTRRIITWICKWFPKSHPLVLYASGLHEKEDFLFVDIETLGLFTRPIILLGVAHFADESLMIHQYLVRSIQEEPAALTGVLSHLSNTSAFVTFNGRTFDLPYIKERLAYYGMRGDLERPHFDALHFSRRAWRNTVRDHKLTTLERQFLGVRRNDVPSALVPEFFETYLRTNNIGPVISIVDHNRQDLIALVAIFSRLCEGCGWA